MPDIRPAVHDLPPPELPTAKGRRRKTRRSEAEFLLSVSNKLAAGGNLDEQLEALVEICSSAVNAERSTIFLNDPISGELYSRVAQGNFRREIRLLNTSGVAGWAYQNAEGVIIQDAYTDERFDSSVDDKTGFRTRSILCAPIRTVRGDVIGVAQSLNKTTGVFNEDDLILLEAMCSQAAIVLQSTLYVERMERSRAEEDEFLGVVSEVSTEIKLGPLLQKIMHSVTRMLNAERSTLFLNDEKTNELYTEIGEGLGATKIRLPNHLGIAGTVFTTAKSVNIPYAYADLRFNPAFDKKTGFFTRSILCVPVINKNGKVIGVTQVLNKKGGAFTENDENRLKAFTAQISIGLENAKLFDDMQNVKNYNESMLESMSNGVVTFDVERAAVTCNKAGFTILQMAAADLIGVKADDIFCDTNVWVVEKLALVAENLEPVSIVDAEFHLPGGKVSVNASFLPLFDSKEKHIGYMMMLEDISNEKRVKATMSRYMDANLADQLLQAGGEDILGGQSSEATILFSDIRSFTSITEDLGAIGTVQLLNEYFTIMVDCIQRQGGMLDKFIGDAIMAVFGTPIPREDDEDRALKAAITMIQELDLFNQARKKQNKKPIRMGIGLNTDLVVSGNIGSPKRMDYTVIGDGVNLAARLESACKFYSATILLSELTVNKLKGTYRLREVDRVVVKGKSLPVGVYEVLDFHTNETFPNVMEVLNTFKGGMAYYREQKWDQAITCFEDALRLNPHDTINEMYLERCRHLKAEPPAADWDGVWHMTEK